jgi:hypothetical protein
MEQDAARHKHENSLKEDAVRILGPEREAENKDQTSSRDPSKGTD